MKRAVIDLGTNSVLLLIVEDIPSSLTLPFTVIADEARICRLGEGLHAHNLLSKPAQERVLNTLRDYKTLCEKHHVDTVTLIATEACRRAKNCDDFRRAIWEELAWTLTVISAETEATLAYRAAQVDFQETVTPIVIDPGGGSTEFITASSPGLRFVSLPLGSVVLTEQFIHHDPPLEDERRQLCAHVDQLLQRSLTDFPRNRPLIALAGTATTLAAIQLQLDHYEAAQVQGYVLSVKQLGVIVERLFSCPLSERVRIRGLHPDRAEVILGGALLLARILHFFKKDQVVTSDRGLRYGILLAQFSEIG